MNASELVNQISSVSLPGVFNPYSDICYAHDHDQSPTVRRQNLRRYLEAIIIREIDSVWVGRDFGYRGGRRTGIALTDEAHLATFRDYFQLTGVAKATHSDEVRERTATYVWNIILEVKAEAFLWNVFPFHPFEGGNP